MLASELALELNVDPSLMSKRLSVYFAERGEVRPRLLDAQTAGQVRQAHELLQLGQAPTFKVAVQMVRGTFVEAIPPESVRALEQRLMQLESVQAKTLDTVTDILRYIESALGHPEAGIAPDSQRLEVDWE